MAPVMCYQGTGIGITEGVRLAASILARPVRSWATMGSSSQAQAAGMDAIVAMCSIVTLAATPAPGIRAATILRRLRRS